MLTRILTLFKQQTGVVSQANLCQQLNISPHLLAHMLQTLERAGHIEEAHEPLPPACPGCDDCPVLDNCSLSDNFLEKKYRLTIKQSI